MVISLPHFTLFSHPPLRWLSLRRRCCYSSEVFRVPRGQEVMMKVRHCFKTSWEIFDQEKSFSPFIAEKICYIERQTSQQTCLSLMFLETHSKVFLNSLIWILYPSLTALIYLLLLLPPLFLFISFRFIVILYFIASLSELYAVIVPLPRFFLHIQGF